MIVLWVVLLPLQFWCCLYSHYERTKKQIRFKCCNLIIICISIARLSACGCSKVWWCFKFNLIFLWAKHEDEVQVHIWIQSIGHGCDADLWNLFPQTGLIYYQLSISTSNYGMSLSQDTCILQRILPPMLIAWPLLCLNSSCLGAIFPFVNLTFVSGGGTISISVS